MSRHFRSGFAAAIMLGIGTACAAQAPMRLEDCMEIGPDQERLACYDRLAQGRKNAAGAAATAAALPPPDKAAQPALDKAAQPAAAPGDRSSLGSHWELDPADKRGVFTFRPHRENYLIATYNPSPNDAPYRPFRSLTPGADGLAHTELAFQLGFKLKLAETPFDRPFDLWFGYTQRSFWQATNHSASSPFRETDYQPELMAVFPANIDLPGLKLRFINLGLVHQSNGQGSTLSRSWNRAYAQFGFERGDFSLLARVWKRFNENAASDDNPDIVNYMGHGDLNATYRRNGHEFSVLARRNFHTDKGAVQLGWAFPLNSNLKGYVQFFSGYGQTLIDYNAYQRVLGLGFLVKFR
jgi:phospholipase A1